MEQMQTEKKKRDSERQSQGKQTNHLNFGTNKSTTINKVKGLKFLP